MLSEMISNFELETSNNPNQAVNKDWTMTFQIVSLWRKKISFYIWFHHPDSQSDLQKESVMQV